MGHHGLLLAAGAGTRMGKPKALMRDPDGTSWLSRTVAVLREGGCEAVTVVLGAGADDAAPLLRDTGAAVVVAEDWSEGMGASLRAGLRALAGSDAVAAVVMLVDLPDVTAEVVRHVAARVTGPGQLARASYAGRPGHPVVIGRDHWAAAADSVAGTREPASTSRATVSSTSTVMTSLPVAIAIVPESRFVESTSCATGTFADYSRQETGRVAPPWATRPVGGGTGLGSRTPRDSCACRGVSLPALRFPAAGFSTLQSSRRAPRYIGPKEFPRAHQPAPKVSRGTTSSAVAETSASASAGA